jgi:hypothetical protein
VLQKAFMKSSYWSSFGRIDRKNWLVSIEQTNKQACKIFNHVTYYSARASEKINMINIPTYNLFDASTLFCPPNSPPSSPPVSSFQNHFRPPSAFKPKPLTPASPIIPIVPPAARQESPQHNPAPS